VQERLESSAWTCASAHVEDERAVVWVVHLRPDWSGMWEGKKAALVIPRYVLRQLDTHVCTG